MNSKDPSSLSCRALRVAAICVFAWTCAFGATALAQEPTYAVALFTPNLDFRDGVARKDFVTSVASQLSDQTGVAWAGIAFARQSDFEAALRKGEVDVAIVDGEYFAAKGSKLTPLASLTAGRSPSRGMKLFVRRGQASALHQLRGRTLVLAQSGGYAEKFVTGDVLGAEVGADQFFGKIDYVKDVRAAINAVELSKADATVAFDGYGSTLTEVMTTSAVPLPIIAATSSRMSDDLLGKVKKASRGLQVSGASLVSGASSYNAEAIRRYRGKATSKRHTREPLMMAPEALALNLARPSSSSTRTELDVTTRGEPFALPALDLPDLLIEAHGSR